MVLIKVRLLVSFVRMSVVLKALIFLLIPCVVVFGCNFMACYSPLSAWQLTSGDIVFNEAGDILRPLNLSCGQCVGCRLERSRQWAIRCLHECQCHASNLFVTLTYDDAHLPRDGSLNYSDFQYFMKRLRKAFSHRDAFKNLWHLPIRYYMCGEYGESFSRPHFHACLFGLSVPDKKFLKRLPSGSNLYTSQVLSDVWDRGYVSLGDVTFESAAYVARYVMKKVTGDLADDHYRSVDENGEVFWRVPEFTRMSLKPGIGARWFERFGYQVYPRDYVVVNGMKMMPPKYYDKLLLADNFDLAEYMTMVRENKAVQFAGDRVPARLRVREIVTKARLAFKLRTLE